MNFENPVWLAMTPLIVLLIAGLIIFGLTRRNARLSQFAAKRLLDRLTEKASAQRTLAKAGLIVLATAMICISLARPQYGVDFVERRARGLDIVFVLDSSRSMLATDLRPTRLERAKLAIIDLVEKLESDRIGLVVFAGSAFLQTPPTLDYAAFRENLNSVSPSSISRGGSNIGQALREAAKAFPKDDNFKVVVLLTDGEDLEEQAIDTAREVAEDGIKVYAIGMGTPEGAYLKIRTEDGADEFVRDPNGQPVRSRLDETTLQEISRLTGGSYSRLAGQSLEMLYSSVLSILPREERMSELHETRIERYQWVLFTAIFFLILEILIRRRKATSAQLIIALALLNMMIPTPSYADATNLELSDEHSEEITTDTSSTDPRSLYNQANINLMKGNYAEARNLYEQAIEYSDDIELERDGLYNLGHAMSQIGEEALQSQDFESAIEHWQQAEELFKSANELDSADAASLEDAKQMAARRKALEAFLDQQNSQDQQQNNDSDQQQDSEAESDKDQQSKENSSSDDPSDQSDDTQTSESSSAKEQSSTSENASENGSSNSADKADSESSQDQNAASTSSEDAGSEETESNQSAESTQDSKASMQQQDEKAVPETESEDAPENGKSETLQETAEGANGSAEAQGNTAVIQGMNISEAQLLLDSLRNDEQLLPFTDSSNETRNSGRNAENRNW